MKITAVSDIHASKYVLNRLKNCSGDFLFIVGDLSNFGEEYEIKKALNVISSCNFRFKVIVLGNHDLHVTYDWCKKHFPDIIFLKNEIVNIEGVRIYGTPYTKKYKGWAYEYDKDIIDKTIPKEEVDIILAHEPPSDYFLSLTYNMTDIGNVELKEYIQKNKVLLFCGHCHECGGNSVQIGETKCYNVAGVITEIDYENKIWKEE